MVRSLTSESTPTTASERQTMNNRIIAAAIVGVAIVCLAVSYKRVGGAPNQELVRMPSAFKTAIEGINIVGINLVYEGPDNKPVLDVTIHNNTSRNVMAIELLSITSTDSSGYGRGSPRETPILPAFGTTTMKFQASALFADAPLSVAAVVWDDGSASGYPSRATQFKETIFKYSKNGGSQ